MRIVAGDGAVFDNEEALLAMTGNVSKSLAPECVPWYTVVKNYDRRFSYEIGL